MRNPQSEGEIRQLVAALPPVHEPILLHLLTCAVCRDLAVVQLLAERAGGAVGPYGAPCEVVTVGWDLLDQILNRDEALEVLGVELLAVQGDRRWQAIENGARFHRLDLASLLLDTSGHRLPQEPQAAAEVARLALEILNHLHGREEGRLLSKLASRGSCLVAGALRLTGDPKAEDAFDDAAFFLAAPFESSDRGRFSRSLALLRWERGRVEEAAALLRHAAESFAMLGLLEEEGVSLALLGLLFTELADPGRALGPLQRARMVTDAGRLSWLAVRAGLALALAWADLGEPKRAGLVLKEALLLRPLVKNADELIVSYWMEGRIGARLGSPEAQPLLESVRRKLLATGRFPETALVSLDLALLLAMEGELGGIPHLQEDLQAAFPEKAGLTAASNALHRVVLEAERGTDLRILEADLALFLRRTFRFQGERIDPLPFA